MKENQPAEVKALSRTFTAPERVLIHPKTAGNFGKWNSIYSSGSRLYAHFLVRLEAQRLRQRGGSRDGVYRFSGGFHERRRYRDGSGHDQDGNVRFRRKEGQAHHWTRREQVPRNSEPLSDAKHKQRNENNENGRNNVSVMGHQMQRKFTSENNYYLIKFRHFIQSLFVFQIKRNINNNS
nr:uncharacterized protein LOC115258050 [Aedes albopictus]